MLEDMREEGEDVSVNQIQAGQTNVARHCEWGLLPFTREQERVNRAAGKALLLHFGVQNQRGEIVGDGFDFRVFS